MKNGVNLEEIMKFISTTAEEQFIEYYKKNDIQIVKEVLEKMNKE